MTETLHVGAERSPFVMLPTWLLQARGVSDGAKVLYCQLHDLVAGREGPTAPVTRGQLAERCGVSVDTVDRRLGELIAAGAVDKQAQFETRQGQLANVYWVRLSPPAAAVRPPVDNPEDPGRSCAAPPTAATRPALPQACGDPRRNGAAPTAFKEPDQEIPPQPPRTAGGLNAPQPNGNSTSRRAGGTNARSLKVNPRAGDEALAAERERERVAEAEAVAERKEANRRAAEEAAEAAARAGEAERLALSATLDDEALAAVVERVTTGLAGPLARSPLAVSRSVVLWCRAASALRPGPLPAALAAGLAAGLDRQAAEDAAPPPPLDLAPAPPETGRLQDRIRTLRAALDAQLVAAATP